MRILFVTHAYYPSRGGVQWRTQALAERFAAQAGDEVTVFTTVARSCQLFIDPRQPRLPVGVECLNGVYVRRFDVFNRLTWLRLNAARVAYKLHLPGQDWLRGLYFGPLAPGLRAAIAQHPADVIMASSFPMIHMYDALAAGQRSRRPVILSGTVHPADPWSYDLPRMYRAIARAQAYVAHSSYEADYLTPRCPGARIHLIGDGVDAAALYNPQAGRNFRHRQTWGEQDIVIVMVGRITSYKRFDVMLDAMPAIWRELPSARLLLAGAGGDSPEASALQRRISTLPHPDRIVWVTDFAEEEKPAIFSAADLVVHLSEREAFGIVIIEAWAAGKPVVASRAGAAPSIITDGVDGLLVTYGCASELAQAVVTLGKSAALRARLGQAGQRKSRSQYDWSVIASRYRSLFAELAASDLK